MKVDVAIVGGGPAGLALAIHAARAGLVTRLFERRPGPPDKACGEGLMPAGVEALRALRVLERIPPLEAAPFEGIRWTQEDGATAEARFAAGHGLGVRRTVLEAALEAEAGRAGASLCFGAAAALEELSPERAVLRVAGERVECALLVAADGLASPLRHAAGLDRPPPGPRRFGLRRHLALAPWSAFVEVHWGRSLEAYVTPVGPALVCVAFLFEDAALPGPHSFDAFLRCFPSLRARLGDAPFASEARGAGPLQRSASARSRDRLVLLGDAAGYVDALTGEGLSLALHAAADLAAVLPLAVAAPRAGDALEPFEREAERAFRRYAAIGTALLALGRRAALRRVVVRRLARHPALFRTLLGWAG